MNKVTLTYGVALIVALLASYFSWTHEPAKQKAETTGVTILNIAKGDLQSLRYTSPDFNATIKRESDAFGEFLWVETNREVDAELAKSNPHDRHALVDRDITKTEPVGKLEKRTMLFKAEKKAGDTLFEAMEPFVVLRDLGLVEESKRSEYGLEAPTGTMTLKTKTKEHVFKLGEPDYSSRHTYLMDDQNKVYAIKQRVLNSLFTGDQRLTETKLHPFKLADVVGVSVDTGSSKATIYHNLRADPINQNWSKVKNGEANETASGWVESKLFPLKALGYVPKGLEPKPLELAMTVKLTPADAKPVVVKIYRGETAKGKPGWFASSDYTRGLVKLAGSLASDSVDDFANVVATP